MYNPQKNKILGCQYNDGRKINGKINRKSVYGNSRQEVKDKLHKQLNNVSKGISTAKCDVTIYELGKELLETKYASNKIKGTSYCSTNYPLKKINGSNLGNIKIQKAAYKDIQDFLNTTTKLSNSYIQKIMIQIFNEAVNRDYIFKNPMKPVSEKETKK